MYLRFFPSAAATPCRCILSSRYIGKLWIGIGREKKESISLLCPITPQLPREGGRENTLGREYTTVEVEGIVRCLIWRTSSGKDATVLEVALYEEVAEYVKEHEEERDCTTAARWSALPSRAFHRLSTRHRRHECDIDR